MILCLIVPVYLYFDLSFSTKIMNLSISATDSLSVALPGQVTLQKVIQSGSPSATGRSNFVDLVIAGGGALNGTVDGYCIDPDRPIDMENDDNANGVIDPSEVGTSYTAKVYSSYESLPSGLLGQPENLDLVNWILNQDFSGKASSSFGFYNSTDIQQAIWVLIGPSYSLPEDAIGSDWYNRTSEIISLARANGEGFVPSFGQKIGVILVPDTNGDSAPDAQIMITPVVLSQLGSTVFHDSDADGLQEVGEVGIAGARVNLLADINGDGQIDSGEVIATTTTDGNGDYSFTVVAGNYRVQFETPEGFNASSPANRGNDDAVDSDGMVSGVVSLAAGEKNTTVDSGFYQLPDQGGGGYGSEPTPPAPASLGDRIWFDTNRNGLQDAGEKGAQGIQVNLIDGGEDGIIGTNDDAMLSTTTDVNGNYKFENLIAGREYQVQVGGLPQGYEFTQANVGSNDATDSDVNASSGKTQIVTLVAGEHYSELDAGIIAKPSSLGDRVWLDANKNGLQDAGETGVQGVKVTLRGGGADGILGNADDTSVTTTTDINGNYKFENLSAGTQYQVAFSALPSGYQFTTANVGNNGNDATDSDANASTGLTQIVTLAAGEHNSSLDAGLILKPVISAALQGTNCIVEGNQGSYSIRLDQVSDRDRYFTIQIDNGTAKRVDHWAGNQDIMWGGSYDTRDSRGRVIKETFGYVAQGRAGDTSDDRKMVGPADASWDYTLYKNGQIDTGNTVTLKVAAGQSVSESFQVQTWNERITVDRDHHKASSRTGFNEGTETFSMKIISADADQVTTGSLGVSIKDNSRYDFVSPIALDLNGDGIQTLSVNHGVQFDLLNTGTKVNTGWLSGEDAFLAIDSNGNGQIDDRSELFGGGVGEGFAKLASFDSNGDGWVDALDARFSELLVWQDANQNAITEDGELRSLAATGISRLNLSYTSPFTLDAQGNILGETSVAQTITGKELAMVDVYFQVATQPAASSI